MDPNKNPDNSEINFSSNVVNIGSVYSAFRDKKPEAMGLVLHSGNSTSTTTSISQSFSISFNESIHYLVNKDSLEQEFNWVDKKKYTFSEETPPRGWALYHLGGLGWHSTVQMQITEISVRKHTSSMVPEPSAISLLLLASLLMLFLRQPNVSSGNRIFSRYRKLRDLNPNSFSRSL